MVVRSQEIDSLGESGMTQLARRVMEMVIGNVARAVGRLANADVDQFVIAADHDHLFAAECGDDVKSFSNETSTHTSTEQSEAKERVGDDDASTRHCLQTRTTIALRARDRRTVSYNGNAGQAAAVC